MDPQAKVENIYPQNTLKFHKILILATEDSTGAQHLEKGGENGAQNDKFMENFKNVPYICHFGNNFRNSFPGVGLLLRRMELESIFYETLMYFGHRYSPI